MTNSEITLRQATLEDLDAVAACLHEFAPKMLREAGATEDQIDEWLRFNGDRPRWRRRLVSEGSAVVVAELNNEIVGIGYVSTSRDLDYAIAARFRSLYVKKQGLGIGTAIMRERLRLASLFKADYAQLECSEANLRMRYLAEKIWV